MNKAEQKHLLDWVNQFIATMKEYRFPAEDSIYQHVKSLEFPVIIAIIAGNFLEGLARYESFELPIPPTVQTVELVAATVSSVIGYSWLFKKPISVRVMSGPVGFGFESGKGPDDVLIRTLVAERYSGTVGSKEPH